MKFPGASTRTYISVREIFVPLIVGIKSHDISATFSTHLFGQTLGKAVNVDAFRKQVLTSRFA